MKTLVAPLRSGVAICLFFIFANLPSPSLTQDALEYSITDESGALRVGDVIDDSHLRDEYTQTDFDVMTFDFVASSAGHESMFRMSGRFLETRAPLDREQFCAQLQECTLQLSIRVQPFQYFTVLQVPYSLE